MTRQRPWYLSVEPGFFPGKLLINTTVLAASDRGMHPLLVEVKSAAHVVILSM